MLLIKIPKKISNYFFLHFFFPYSTNTFTNIKGQQEPLVRRSSQPKKSPVAAEASPEAVGSPPSASSAAPIAGAAAVASPSPPVTSPEVGTDSEAAKGNFRRKSNQKQDVHFFIHTHDQKSIRCAFLTYDWFI